MPTTATRKPSSQNASSKKASQQRGASTKGKPQSGAAIQEEVAATLKRLEAKDPGLKQLLKKAHGYAVFPSVGRASLVLGGSYGRGGVFERGKFIGTATLGQTTIGVQVGGETYSEVIVFENEQALERFKQGKVKFAANASAVLVKAGAAGVNNYEKGVQVLAYSRGGMLLELSIGGQKFNFKPEGAGGAAQGGEGEEGEEEEGGEDQGESSSNGTGLMGLVGGVGVKRAASSVGGLVKKHPVTATIVGTGLAAGIAYMARRRKALAGSGASSGRKKIKG